LEEGFSSFKFTFLVVITLQLINSASSQTLCFFMQHVPPVWGKPSEMSEHNNYLAMKGNQGLEALAALCGGQSDAPTQYGVSRGPTETTQGQGGTPGGSNSTNLGASHDTLPTMSQQLVQQSPLHNLTQQQWQQALAAVSALQGNGGGQSSLAQSLLMSGLQSTGMGDNAYTSAMQQFALQRYIQTQAQAQAKLSASQQAFADPNQQALMMALASGKAQQLQQSRGKFEESSPSKLYRLFRVASSPFWYRNIAVEIKIPS
jgi:hypothetical protein